MYGEFESEFRPKRGEIVSILQAGCAKLLTVNQACSAKAHFLVTKESRPVTEAKMKQLMGAGICVVSPMFVVDWLAFPTKDLSYVRLLYLIQKQREGELQRQRATKHLATYKAIIFRLIHLCL